MELRCEGCAGCCLDWRPLLEGSDADSNAVDSVAPNSSSDADAEDARGGRSARAPAERWEPLDDCYNLVPLTRDEVRAFLEAGLGDALAPRLWTDEDGVSVGDHRVAAVRDRPAFFVGLRKPPKPVAPFDRDGETWLPACVFLDPTTLQCRVHGEDIFPDECAEYPAHNLALGARTECERVENATGQERLLEDDGGAGSGGSGGSDGSDGSDEAAKSDRASSRGTVHVDPDDVGGMLLGPQAIGGKLFAHPRPEDVGGAVDRIARDEATDADRAEFVAIAAASSPGTLALSDPHYEEAREAVLSADSWAGRAIRDWTKRSAAPGSAAPAADLASTVEDERGAPGTPGWDAIRDE